MRVLDRASVGARLHTFFKTQTRATIGVYYFFFGGFLHLGA